MNFRIEYEIDDGLGGRVVKSRSNPVEAKNVSELLNEFLPEIVAKEFANRNNISKITIIKED